MAKHPLYGARRQARIEVYMRANPKDPLIGYLGTHYDTIERIIVKTESMEFILGEVRRHGIRDGSGKELTLESLTLAWQTMNEAILRGVGRDRPAPGFLDPFEPPPKRRRKRPLWPTVRQRKPRHDDGTGEPPADRPDLDPAAVDSGVGAHGPDATTDAATGTGDDAPGPTHETGPEHGPAHDSDEHRISAEPIFGAAEPPGGSDEPGG